MYCPKCGTKTLDGAGFCQNCSVKLSDDTPAEQSAPVLISDNQIHQSYVVPPNIPEKKNPQKIILGIVGSVAVIAMIAIVLILRGRTKYPDELLFDDLPATRFFEITQDDLIAEYGELDHTGFDKTNVCFDRKSFALPIVKAAVK